MHPFCFYKKKNFFAFDSKLVQLVYFGMVSSIRVHVFINFLQVVQFKIRMTDWKQIILNIHCIFTQKASFKNCFLWQIEAWIKFFLYFNFLKLPNLFWKLGKEGYFPTVPVIWYNGSTHNLVSLSCLSDGEKCMMTYEDRSRNHLWFTFFVRYNFHNAIFITSATQGFCPHIASISFSMSIISCILIKCRNFNVLEIIYFHWYGFERNTYARPLQKRFMGHTQRVSSYQ